VTAVSTDRAPAQYCAYCGETNLWPHEAGHGAWECRDCGRVFTVKYLGLSGAVRSIPSSNPGGAS
jgi:ribosomal protein L37AE/L43A